MWKLLRVKAGDATVSIEIHSLMCRVMIDPLCATTSSKEEVWSRLVSSDSLSKAFCLDPLLQMPHTASVLLPGVPFPKIYNDSFTAKLPGDP